MRYIKISEANTYVFLEHLKGMGNLFAPMKISDKSFDFCEIDDVKEIEFDYSQTLRPPRRFFYPEEETMFTYDSIKQEMKTVLPRKREKRVILFGVHSCDIVGLRIMDAEFLDEQEDIYYKTRREKGVIIGLSCLPDEHCFCNVRRIEFVDAGFDLFFHKLPDGYLVRVGTVTGHKLVDPYPELFEEVTEVDTIHMEQFEAKKSSMYPVQGNWDSLRYYLELRMEHLMYERESEKCLGCGNCTLTCPTCRCYDCRDIPNLDGVTGTRIRVWDSCQFRSHGLVAGNHNFRPTKKDRFFNRYQCKNAYCPETTTSYCVGCGRCTAFCPAGINFKSNLIEIGGYRGAS